MISILLWLELFVILGDPISKGGASADELPLFILQIKTSLSLRLGLAGRLHLLANRFLGDLLRFGNFCSFLLGLCHGIFMV